MNKYGTSANGIDVFDASAINGHVHDDVVFALKDAIGMIELPTDKTFVKFAVDLKAPIGVDHLVKTDEHSEIHYARRGNRPGLSRFVMNQDAEPTNILNLILCIPQDVPTDSEFAGKWVVVTAFAGSPGEREPWDSSLKTDEQKKAAADFWATHALVPTPEERKMIEEKN